MSIESKPDAQGIVRDNKGRFAPGHCPSPGGKGSWRGSLEKVLRDTATEKRKSILEHAVSRAYESDVVLAALLKKILPDLRSLDATVTQPENAVRLVINFPGGGAPVPMLADNASQALPEAPEVPLLEAENLSENGQNTNPMTVGYVPLPR